MWIELVENELKGMKRFFSDCKGRNREDQKNFQHSNTCHMSHVTCNI